MRHPAIVGAALDLVSALAAGEGLALVAPVFGVWGAPTEAHDLPAFWASRVIARAEGARQFVLLSISPPLTGTRRVSVQSSEACPLAGRIRGDRPFLLGPRLPDNTRPPPVRPDLGCAIIHVHASRQSRRGCKSARDIGTEKVPLLSQAQGVRHA